MGHRIMIDEAKLNANYEQMMDEVYLLYHTYPTNLTPINPSEAEIAQCSEYDAMGRELARQQVNNPEWRRFLPNGAQIVNRPDGSTVIRIFRDGVELKKKTIYPRDNAYSNGLPVMTSTATRPGDDAGCLFGLLLVAVAWIGLLAWAVMR